MDASTARSGPVIPARAIPPITYQGLVGSVRGHVWIAGHRPPAVDAGGVGGWATTLQCSCIVPIALFHTRARLWPLRNSNVPFTSLWIATRGTCNTPPQSTLLPSSVRYPPTCKQGCAYALAGFQVDDGLPVVAVPGPDVQVAHQFVTPHLFLCAKDAPALRCQASSPPQDGNLLCGLEWHWLLRCGQ